MYNSDMPTRAELPTTKQLIRSTLIALSTAIVLLVTVILPAEYAIDPTGVGKVLGLMEMGEIKAQLEQEAAEDEARTRILVATKVESEAQKTATKANELVEENMGSVAESNKTEEPVWRDRKIISLEPGQGAEVKLVMNKGQVAQYEWRSKGGPVNHDTHGDGNGQSISYERGRGVPSGEGELVAAFDGSHGWFFRNRNKGKVMVILKTNGDYAQIKRVL
ncbi:transmembrane anchor protein [Vibrio owensii]|uniref:transmembrane anchor protein n=1 Tax=Vibrio owensii TaxID=696485 RepID=UPI0033978FD0